MQRILFPVLLAIAAISCGKDEKKDPTADEVRAGQLNIEVAPEKALGNVVTALSSVASVQSASGKSLNPVIINTALTGVDDYCQDSGIPRSDISRTSSNYAAMSAYCNFAKNPDGPDTVLGAIDRVRAMLCMIGQPTYDGVEKDVTVTFSTACFSKTFIDRNFEGRATDAQGKVTAYATVDASLGNPEYSKMIKLNVPAYNLEYHILFKQSGAVLAASIRRGSGEGGTEGQYFAVHLDRGTKVGDEGTIRVDGRFSTPQEVQDPGSPSFYARHVRGFAKGLYELETNTMTTASQIEFALADVNATSAELFTTRGNVTEGFYSLSKMVSTYPSDYTAWAAAGNEVGCHGDGSCSGNTGIRVSSAADLAFMKSGDPRDSAYVSALSMFKNTGLLNFNSVNLAE